jgi:hypothetical protein
MLRLSGSDELEINWYCTQRIYNLHQRFFINSFFQRICVSTHVCIFGDDGPYLPIMYCVCMHACMYACMYCRGWFCTAHMHHAREDDGRMMFVWKNEPSTINHYTLSKTDIHKDTLTTVETFR